MFNVRPEKEPRRRKGEYHPPQTTIIPIPQTQRVYWQRQCREGTIPPVYLPLEKLISFKHYKNSTTVDNASQVVTQTVEIIGAKFSKPISEHSGEERGLFWSPIAFFMRRFGFVWALN